jgi:hypothetical protein
MSRAMWFFAGAATSAYAMLKARRAAEALTPEGMQDRLAGLQKGVRLFGEELGGEMATKETELRERLGLGDDGPTRIGGKDAPRLRLTREGST